MVDIFPQAVSWPSPSQYIQSIINANPSGTTYVLKSGVHRMQTIRPKTNDTIVLEQGAVMRGSEDVSGWTWTQSGATWWTTLSSNDWIGGDYRTGYEPWRYHIILDGEPMAYQDSTADVDAWTAYYDDGANRLYIGRNPGTLSTMELSRQQLAIEGANSSTTGVSIIADDRAYPGVWENYCPGLQSENSGFRAGRNGTQPINNANWLVQDQIVRNFHGMALAHGDTTTLRRISLYNTGQLGIGGSYSDDAITENCAIYRNGIGEWKAGWEGGNTKWANVDRHINRGNWYDTIAPDEELADVHPHVDMTGPLWYDIANDGVEIYSNHILDRGHIGGRGLFYEISFSVKIYNNWLYELGWDSENSFWYHSIIMSTSGAIDGVSHFDKTEVTDNINYNCSGTLKLENTVRGSSGSSSSIPSQPYACRDIIARRNAFQLQTGLTFGNGLFGTDGQNNGGTPFGQGLTYEDNLYNVPNTGGNYWRVDGDSLEGTPNGTMNWSTWTGRGYDSPNGVLRLRDSNDPFKDFNPYRGGCL